MLAILSLALEIVPVIENPGSSLINKHPRFQWLVRVLRRRGFGDPHLHYILGATPECGMCMFSSSGFPTVFLDETMGAQLLQADDTLVDLAQHSSFLQRSHAEIDVEISGAHSCKVQESCGP